MLEDRLGVEGHVHDAVVSAVDLNAVGDQRVPVVEVVELGVDAVVVLEVGAVGEVRLEGQAEVILAQVLHIVLNGDLDDLADNDKPGGLVDALVVPVGVNLQQLVAHPVVFPHPDG